MHHQGHLLDLFGVYSLILGHNNNEINNREKKKTSHHEDIAKRAVNVWAASSEHSSTGQRGSKISCTSKARTS